MRVRNGADEQVILATVYRIFSKYVTHLTVQVDKDPPIDWLLPGDAAAQSKGVVAGAGHGGAGGEYGVSLWPDPPV